MTSPTFSQLFGITYVDSANHWTFSTDELDRVNLDNYGTETNAVICAIHEMMIRTYRGTLRDENANKLVDSIGGFIYNFAVHYTEVKLVPLSKRLTENAIIYNYLWWFSNKDTDYDSVILNLSQPLVSFSGNTVLISKAVLQYPTTVIDFLYNFVAYMRQSQPIGILVNDYSFVEISLNNNSILDLDADDIVS